MRKLAAFILAACMLFALTACGGDGGKTAGKGEFLGLQDGEEFTTDKEISLKFTRPKGNAAQESWWDEAIAAFNTAYAGRIKVTEDVRQRAANNTYESQIGSLNKAKKMPDVLYMDGPYVSNWAYNGMIIPLDNYLTQTYLADFMDYVIDQGTYNDRLYTLSIVDSAIMVFYRKEIMNGFLNRTPKPKYKVGKRKNQTIALPASVEDAWTFDELADIAEQMRADLGGGKTQYGLSISGDKTEWMSYAFTPMWGGDMLGEDTLTAAGNINSAKGYAAANYLRDLVSKKCINPDAADTDFYSDAAAGTAIKASMYLTGTQNITQFNQSEQVAEDWSATYYPRLDGQDYAVPCGGWTLALTAACPENKRVAAAEFIKYLTSSASCEKFARDTASPPARKSLYASMDEYKDGSTVQDGAYVKMKQQLAYAQPRTKTIAYAIFSAQLSAALNDVVSQNDIVVRTRLDSAVSAIDDKIRTDYRK